MHADDCFDGKDRVSLDRVWVRGGALTAIRFDAAAPPAHQPGRGSLSAGAPDDY